MQRFKVKTKLATVTVTVKDGMSVDPYKMEQYAQEAPGSRYPAYSERNVKKFGRGLVLPTLLPIFRYN